VEEHAMAATVYTRLKKLIIDQLGAEDDEITPAASFTDDLNADSLELAELTSAIEEEFDIEIEDEDARRLQTVQDVIEYLEENVG
jgi:acyl carrier protein